MFSSVTSYSASRRVEFPAEVIEAGKAQHEEGKQVTQAQELGRPCGRQRQRLRRGRRS